MPTDPAWSGGTAYRDERSTPVDAPIEDVWRAVEGIGGDRGWYSFRWPGRCEACSTGWSEGLALRRGRRDPDRLAVGDAVDFWRVEALERPTCCGCGPR